MIAKKSKFPLRTNFIRFRSVAKKSPTPHTLIYHLHSSHLSRLAVVIPKKVSKLATTRNYLKRVTYDTLWPLIKDKNIDCVVVYKPLPFKKSPTIIMELTNELTQVTRNF